MKPHFLSLLAVLFNAEQRMLLKFVCFVLPAKCAFLFLSTLERAVSKWQPSVRR
eukprot:m.161428 g.161428  ORF g.161428 m.161428 type:complete len:54 (+) comp17644_c0_seq2:1309-1470(+)